MFLLEQAAQPKLRLRGDAWAPAPAPSPLVRTFPLLAAQNSGSLRPFRNMRSALGNEAAWRGARQLQRCCLLASGPTDLPAKWLPGQEVQWCFEAGRLVRRLWVHQGLLQWWGTVSINLQPGSRESEDRPLELHFVQGSSWAARSLLVLCKVSVTLTSSGWAPAPLLLAWTQLQGQV